MDNAALSLALDGDGQLITDDGTTKVLAENAKRLQPYCICPITEYEVGVAIMLMPLDRPPDTTTMQRYVEWVYLRTHTEPARPITIPEGKAIEARGDVPPLKYALLAIRGGGGKGDVFAREDARPFLTKAADALEHMLKSPVQVEQVVGAIALTMPPGTYILGRDIDLENPQTLATLASVLDRVRYNTASLPQAEHSKEEDDQ